MSKKTTAGHDVLIHGRWTPEDAARLYRIPEWGKGLFGTNAAGHLTVRPWKTDERCIDLLEVVEGLAERGIEPPVLVRFSDVLEQRLREIGDVFARVIADEEYAGRYSCVYPIKVNQQRHFCEEIRDLGSELGFGLEAGSKPELLAILGLTAGRNQMPIVCNGFKDDEYIEMVTLATKLGRNITVVVEKLSELSLVLKQARRYGTCPKIGIRAKLSTRGAGRWEGSGGFRSKFGLFMSEVLLAVDMLRAEGLLDRLHLVHCHIGSQVSDIRSLRSAMNELARVYTELHGMGAGLDTLDVGGGLGVDYDGSQTAWQHSTNYTIEEYAREVVYRIKVACDEGDVPHPDIFSESGRAMVAYSSVLVANAIGTSRLGESTARLSLEEIEKTEEIAQPVLELQEVQESLAPRNLLESYHRSIEARDQAGSLFSLGHLSLRQRALSEEMFWAISRRLLTLAERAGELPEELQPIQAHLSDIYFCNFSLFQSLPDAWAIDQVFPICPIHRLDEQPTCHSVLADITCDSDGMIDHFVDKREDKRTLELHPLRPGEPYYLGFFLIGAYQEILGDLHNLFGDTNAVHVSIDEDGAWDLEEVVRGDLVRDVLRYVQFDPDALRSDLRRELEKVVKQGEMTVTESRNFLRCYDMGLEGYTYLESEAEDVPVAGGSSATPTPRSHEE